MKLLRDLKILIIIDKQDKNIYLCPVISLGLNVKPLCRPDRDLAVFWSGFFIITILIGAGRIYRDLLLQAREISRSESHTIFVRY